MYGPHTVHRESDHLHLTELLVDYHDSGAYQKDIETVGQQALEYLDSLPSNVEGNAIVLDLDETSWFNNWPSLINPELGGEKHWAEWIRQAAAKPIPTTVELVNLANSKGIATFFITGRGEAMKDDTLRNLDNAGYKGWEELYLYPDSIDKHRQLVFPEAATFKTAVRWNISRSGYTIVLNMGDQRSDIIGGFAQQSFKLPNPFYSVI